MRTFCLALTFLFTSFLSATLMTSSSMDEVFRKMSAVDEETLVIFDIDETLTMTKNPLFQRPNITKHKELYKEAFKSLSNDQKQLLINLQLQTRETVLVENGIIGHINRLQEQKVRVIALSACLTGKFNGELDLAKWRISELNRLGIDLKKSFLYVAPFEFSDLKTMYGTYPTFKEGLICANGTKNSKGEVLVEFLKVVNFQPKKVIFVDDKVENALSVEEEMEKRNIPCQCFLYKGAEGFIAEEFYDKDEVVKELMKAVNRSLVVHYEFVRGKEG
jgi:hypothetical protein